MRRLLTLITAAAAAATLATVPAAAQPDTSTVTVDPHHVLRTFGRGTIGADMPFWNGKLLAPGTVARIRAAGIKNLDFDAGAPLDLYDFRTNTLRRDPQAARDKKLGDDWQSLTPRFSFDQFEHVARESGATTTVHVNYGTGTPAEAAQWVRYANIVRHDHVRDWMVGEEVYFDQLLEPNRRLPSAGWSVTADARSYARGVIEFSRAMKAVDPRIRVGAEAIAIPPSLLGGTDEQNPAQYYHDWTRALITTPGFSTAVDYLDIHWFGDFGASTIDQQLAARTEVGPALGELRSALDARPRGRHVAILAGEVNSTGVATAWLEKQSNAAYLADTELNLLAHGVEQTHWFALYSGIGGTPSPAYDFGLLSSGACLAAATCEPAVGTPFAPYYAQQLVGRLVRPGARLIATHSTGDVSSYATVRHGRLAVLLVNRSGTGADPATVQLPHRWAHRCALVSQATGHGITTTRHAHLGPLILPPYSVTLLQL